MDYRVRGLLAVLVAAAALAACVGSASAQALALANSGVRYVFPEFTMTAPGFTVKCPVTMEGTFHSRTIAKTAGTLIGYITRVAIRTESCTGGRITALTPPWHLQYGGFTGVLPEIRTVEMRVVEAGFLMEIMGISCLYRTTSVTAAGLISELLREKVATVRWSEASRIPLLVGTGLCPGEVRFGGGGRSSVLGSAEEVEITLVP
ncbi:MAG TPA: hypothetical protein VFU94_07065 [Conexibacter sp.]|nr:hypothetical protein [Conexibacter sp.]